jgi:hypothetical protein
VSAEDRVRRWLGAKQTGCTFASLIANATGGLTMATFREGATADDVDALFDHAASQRKPAIAVFPTLRTEMEVSDQLLALAVGERWSVKRRPNPTGMITEDVLVGIEWQTAEPALRSSPMGLGPFGTMPVTRRAPYTCIAAWPGGRANKHSQRLRDPTVHFLDVDLSGYRINYKARWDNTVRETSEILLDDQSRFYRNVAFRLSSAVAERLATLPP